MNRIFITGCGGMVGYAAYNYLTQKGYEVLATDIDLNEDWLKNLDIRDYDNCLKMISQFKPEIVLHLAALTSLEYCEVHKKEAYDVNYIGTKNIALICKKFDIPMVHISTAGVFDGEKDKYVEEDLPNPINVYGKTKLYGEMFVENILEKYYIIRPGWMFGSGKKDKKFVSYMISQIKEGRKSFKVVNDTFGTPTYTKDLIKNIEHLFNTKHYGKYHMVCKGETNRYEIAKHILSVINVKDAVIDPVDSDFFKKDFFVTRATSERLINKNLDLNGINLMRTWQEAMTEYLMEDWSHLINKEG